MAFPLIPVILVGGLTALVVSKLASKPKKEVIILTPGGGATVSASEITLAKQRLYMWAQRDGKTAVSPAGFPTIADLNSPFADFRFIEAVGSFQKWANSLGGIEKVPGTSVFARTKGLGAEHGLGVYDNDTKLVLKAYVDSMLGGPPPM